jgi:hypothetical protein
MSDEEYVYRKDIAEKKKIGYGAKHKKNGSKSKKCTMPSDYLTRKEKLAMNSEPVKWCLNDFYTYNDFKKMPSDIQVMYLQGITDKYKVGHTTIGTVLFGLSPNALDSYLIGHKIKDKIHWHSFTGMKARTYTAEFEKAIEARRLAIVDRVPDVEEVEEPIEEIKMEETPVVPEIIRVPAPETPVVDTDIYKSNPLNCVMACDGFDLELFKYLANRYKDKECIVEIRVELKE